MSVVLEPTPDQIAEAERIVAAETQKLKEFREGHRLYWFEPEPDQLPFFMAPDKCAHVRVARGTNRSGKTSVGAIEGIAFALTFRPWMLPGEFKHLRVDKLMEMAKRGELPAECMSPMGRPTKGLIIVEDWGTADEIFTTGTPAKPAKLPYWIPADALEKPPESEQGHTNLYTFRNGSTIKLDTAQSYKNNPMSFEGMAWDWIMFDEPKDRGLVSAACRGLVDTHGYQWHTFTPFNCGPWTYDEFEVKAASNPDIRVFRLHWKHNKHIDHQGMRDYLGTLTEDERLARGEGEYTHLMGLVYKEFIAKPSEEGGHIITAGLTPDWIVEHASVTLEIDPHDRQPLTCLFMASDDRGRNIVFDEIFVRCLMKEFCDKIHQKLTYFGAGAELAEKIEKSLLEYVTWLGIDPIAFEEDVVDKRKWADTFWANGLEVQPGSKRRSACIARTRQMFHDNELFVTSNCVRTIYELQHWVYDEWKNKLNRNEKEKPVDKDDHCMECLGRLVIREPKFERREKSKPINVRYCP